MTVCALIINILIVIIEIRTLGHIKGKLNILKYYSYLQNFLALVASLIFSVALTVCIVYGRELPEFIRGLRYIASCGLLAATFIYIAFLGGGKKIAITEDDFIGGFSPKAANRNLHYICPILSLLGFVVFEREISLTNGVWTSLSALPSCLYWIIYALLSAAKLWEEPYDFASKEGKGALRAGLSYFLIPVSFIALSFVLWSLK